MDNTSPFDGFDFNNFEFEDISQQESFTTQPQPMATYEEVFMDSTPDEDILKDINADLLFGHGPVVHMPLPALTQEQLNALRTEDYDLMNKGYGIEVQEVVDPDNTLNVINYVYHHPPVPVEDIYKEMWDVIEQYEDEAWSAKNIGLTTGWGSIDNALDGGLKSGFIVIGGDSNLGKSGFISQMASQVSRLNDTAYVMDFSLDDPMKDKLPRIVGSMSLVPLNAVKSPKQYQGQHMMLARRRKGILKLKSMVDRYKAYDANFSTDIEDIEAEIRRVKAEFDIMGVTKHLVIFIDNMHDLTVKTKSFSNDKEKYDFIAQWCSDLAIKLDIVVVASAELKKLNGAKRPNLDDIREAVKIKYEAKAVLLVYNEVHYKSEGAAIYFSRTDKTTKQPIFEVHFAKNKFHTYKGRLFFEFYPEMARFEEPSDQAVKTYSSIIFGGL